VTIGRTVDFFFSPGSRYCYLLSRWLSAFRHLVPHAMPLRVAPGLSLSWSRFERALDEAATHELLTENARDAHARGAFGVPAFFLDGVLYWGNDRLALLEHALTQGWRSS
jgi:2-hydroxychromene-2-carboxylate isomerase